MNTNNLSLASEINELESLLASIPESRLIERMSLESRLASVREALATLPQHLPQRVKLTFRGRPVYDNIAISADFGSRAAKLFSDAFAAIMAELSGGLRDMGPIPDRDKNQLLITGTALGSFGFEFELPTEMPTLFSSKTKAQEAMEKIESLFKLAAQRSDDEIAEIIEEVHPRSVRIVYDFLELLVQQNAWCALDLEERSFRFTDYEQIRVSCERLKDENIQERDETYQGEFQGVLPASRTFEFKLSEQDGLIKGKINKAIDDPDILNRDWLYKQTKVKLKAMIVGKGRPRYTLVSLEDLSIG